MPVNKFNTKRPNTKNTKNKDRCNEIPNTLIIETKIIGHKKYKMGSNLTDNSVFPDKIKKRISEFIEKNIRSKYTLEVFFLL